MWTDDQGREGRVDHANDSESRELAGIDMTIRSWNSTAWSVVSHLLGTSIWLKS
jgi:hypothetical protein